MVRLFIISCITIACYVVSPQFTAVKQAYHLEQVNHILSKGLANKLPRAQFVASLQPYEGLSEVSDVHIAGVYKLLGDYAAGIKLLMPYESAPALALKTELDFLQFGSLSEQGKAWSALWQLAEPKNPILLNILALNAIGNSDKAAASNYWNEALASLGPANPEFHKILSLIEKLLPEFNSPKMKFSLQRKFPAGSVLVLRDKDLKMPPLALTYINEADEVVLGAASAMVPGVVVTEGMEVVLVAKQSINADSALLAQSKPFFFEPDGKLTVLWQAV